MIDPITEDDFINTLTYLATNATPTACRANPGQSIRADIRLDIRKITDVLVELSKHRYPLGYPY